MFKRSHLSLFLTLPLLSLALRTVAKAAPAQPPVVITDDADSVTLENGIVSMRVSKANADVMSMQYKDLNVFASGNAYWNVYGSTPQTDPAKVVKTQQKGTPVVYTVTQDPAHNGGEIGEFELLFPYRPGSTDEPLTIAIRYTLRRGDSGVYGWTSVTHKAGYPAFVIEASTVCLKLDPKTFDHLTVDSRRNRQMINGYDWMHGEHLNLKEARRMTTGIHKGEVEHKYDYNRLFSENPTWGWSSSTKKIGVWIVNPSDEYINNGPTRVDYGGHIDLKDYPNANPTLLFIWHSFHYGGQALSINQDENWNKIVGPFLIYCNSGPTPDAMWADALQRAKSEQAQWPYAWAKAPGYASAAERGARDRPPGRVRPPAAGRERQPRVGGPGGGAVYGHRPGRPSRSRSTGIPMARTTSTGRTRTDRRLHHPECAARHIRALRVQQRHPWGLQPPERHGAGGQDDGAGHACRGCRSATGGKSGKSACRTAAPRNSGMATITGSGAFIISIPQEFPHGRQLRHREKRLGERLELRAAAAPDRAGQMAGNDLEDHLRHA